MIKRREEIKLQKLDLKNITDHSKSIDEESLTDYFKIPVLILFNYKQERDVAVKGINLGETQLHKFMVDRIIRSI